jgi:2-oxoisovalerate dehydrogenase E2 component (dihydrolipoyl transacylase)
VSRHVFKLPDLGEGTVSAEIVAWHVKVGDTVREDQPVVEMSTEKAVVEVPSPVTGRVLELAGEPGAVVAVGSELVVFDLGAGGSKDAAAQPPKAASKPAATPVTKVNPPAERIATAERANGAARVMASPATRRRAREAGIDLKVVRGSGPGGRIERADLDRAIAGGRQPGAAASEPTSPAPARVARARREGTEEIKVLGVRRVIAQRMSEAKRSIPHFSYVEEVDITELEALRAHLNGKLAPQAARLTLLPFLVAALARVLESFPQCNAHFDAERETIIRHRAVHAGIATQTKDGLKVPVVRNAESLGLHALAAEIRRVSEAARDNRAKREELTGSTITVTSLGKLGGIASTPVINAPEVAIVGVNRVVERPVVRHGAIAVRSMMNLSSSFDHRFVDGFDAAAMIQALKERLEHPATIFLSE